MATKQTPKKQGPKYPGSRRNMQKVGLESQKPIVRARKMGPKPAGTDWTAAYIDNLTATGYQVKSAQLAGVDITTVYRRRISDPEFLEREQAALKCVQAIFEDELKRRAVNGCENITYGPDGHVKSVRTEYSDTLMLRWLERRDPTWRSKQEIEHSGGVTWPTREERKKALAEAEKATGRAGK